MRRRVTVMNEEYRCTPRSFRCMPLHSEHAGDTNEAFLAQFDTRSTLRPYHLACAAAPGAKRAERELGMAWLWPERLDIEVKTAV